MSQPIRGRGSHLVFSIDTKNINLVEDVEILLPAKFRCIPFSGIRGEKSKMSQTIRGQGDHFVFPIGPKKHKLDRGHWDIFSCQLFLNYVQRFLRRSWKCLIQSEARAVIFFNNRSEKNLVENIGILFLVKFVWIPFSGFREEVENVKS